MTYEAPDTLACEWRQLMCAAEETGISGADSAALIERADSLLGRLAEIPANEHALRAAEIVFRHLSREASNENAIAAAPVLPNAFSEWQLRVEHAERLVADQIGRIEKLNRHGPTETATIARHLLETFETTLGLSRVFLNNISSKRLREDTY
jgi:hypothetical protein